VSTFALHGVKYAALACLTLAAACAGFAALGAPDTLAVRLYHRYATSLELRLRLLFLDVKATHIILAQGAAALSILALAIVMGSPGLLLLLGAVALAPGFVLERMRRKRVEQIEAKLDGFVVALANALRATPSPGRALATVRPVTHAPLDQEIDLVLREMRVGSTLEQALGNLSARVRSFQLDAALSGLLIGRQTGGDVPQILDNAAHTLREMARLNGVLRAKTADARTQANVLSVFPIFLVMAFEWVSPGYFRPLTESAEGFVVTLIALAMWIAAVVMVRRIMEAEL
jgi:tight adherence protein B